MSRRFAPTVLLLAAIFLPTFLVLHADEPGRPTTTPAKASAPKPLGPGPDDGEIAYVTARALEQGHYRQHRLNNDYSEKFFDQYIESLDPQRLHFTQVDLNEFASYRTNLDNLTITRSRSADTTPAYRIFNRFRERLDQRVAYANDLLKNEKFVFDTEEQITVNRKDEPHPADLNEAHQLWRQRLRSEYLGEKIAKYAAKQKAERTPAKTNASALKKDEKNALKDTPKKTEAEEIVETLTRRYTRNSNFYRDMDQQDVLEVYLTSLAHVYDPHTDYFNPRQAENFAIGMNLSLFGIGAVLQADMEGFCKIAEMKPGPAMNSKKIKVGDRIVAVAQSNAVPVDVVDMNLNKIVQLVRGPKGSEVRLTVVSADSTTDRREITLIREEIKLDDQAAKAKVIDYPTGGGKTLRIGVIDLPTFYVPMDTGAGRRPSEEAAHYTSKDVALLLAKLKAENVQGVIVDLRRNGGGSLEECVKLTGLFIKDGPVVQVSGPGGQPFVDEDKDPRIQYDGPLIVLNSRFSASASEIFAGALQDYNRALIVGDLTTHGKGTVQQLNPLRMWISEDTMTNNPGTLKITKAKFYRASGASTQKKGVMSDIVLPSKLNYAKDIGEEAYDTALEYDTIESAHYDKLDMVQPGYVTNLLAKSSQRLDTNQEFAYVREDIEQFRKYQAMNSVSLNEKQRIKEWEEDDARQRARDKERLTRKALEPIVYQLTLKDVNVPGLPPPVAKTNSFSSTTGDTNVHEVKSAFVSNDPSITNQFSRNKLAGHSLPGQTNVDFKEKFDVSSPAVPATMPSLATADDDEEEAPPAVDATLEETERILVDYVTLLTHKGLASKTH